LYAPTNAARMDRWTQSFLLVTGGRRSVTRFRQASEIQRTLARRPHTLYFAFLSSGHQGKPVGTPTRGFPVPTRGDRLRFLVQCMCHCLKAGYYRARCNDSRVEYQAMIRSHFADRCSD
jgi:hypothetical protein